MRIAVCILLSAAIALASVPTTTAEDPDGVEIAVVIPDGDAWVEYCWQTAGSFYIWDRPVCGPQGGCRNGGANVYILTENQCENETCEGDLFIFILSEGNCERCEGEVPLNLGVGNCRAEELVGVLAN